MGLFKRPKSSPVWVKEDDYFKAVKAAEDNKITTFSRVNVRYFDPPTAVIVAVVCFAISILISILN